MKSSSDEGFIPFVFESGCLIEEGRFLMFVILAHNWWTLLLRGILAVIFAILTFVYPGVTAIVLLYMVAAWVIVDGIFEIVTAIRLRKEVSNEWLLVSRSY
jgi:uncharacterized membrane protein HdeD (DUF308 family)